MLKYKFKRMNEITYIHNRTRFNELVYATRSRSVLKMNLIFQTIPCDLLLKTISKLNAKF